MVKDILKISLKVIIVVLAYLLQLFVVNNTHFFGVTGDLCLMVIVIITIVERSPMAYCSAAICGIISDVLFSRVIGKYMAIYIIIVAILLELKKIYKEDNKIAIIIFSSLAVAICEILLYIFNLVITGNMVNLFVFILNILKQSVINICFAYIIYFLFNALRKKESKY